MSISQKMTVFLSLWIVLSFSVMGDSNIELLGVLILIGMLVARELSNFYIRASTRYRVNILIYIGIVFFIVIIGRKVLVILGLI